MTDVNYKQRADELEKFYNSLPEFERKSRYGRLYFGNGRGSMSDEEWVKSYDEVCNLMNILGCLSCNLLNAEEEQSVKKYLDDKIDEQLLLLMKKEVEAEENRG